MDKRRNSPGGKCEFPEPVFHFCHLLAWRPGTSFCSVFPAPSSSSLRPGLGRPERDTCSSPNLWSTTEHTSTAGLTQTSGEKQRLAVVSDGRARGRAAHLPACGAGLWARPDPWSCGASHRTWLVKCLSTCVCVSVLNCRCWAVIMGERHSGEGSAECQSVGCLYNTFSLFLFLKFCSIGFFFFFWLVGSSLLRVGFL